MKNDTTNALMIAGGVGLYLLGKNLGWFNGGGTTAKKGTLYFILTSLPAGLYIKVDGKTFNPGAYPIEVGVHTWTVSAPGYTASPASGTVNIVENETTTVTISFTQNGGPPIVHPLFKVDDIIFPNVVGGMFNDPMRVYHYNPTDGGAAHPWGSYGLTWLSGPNAGGGTGWWVEEADAYFHLGSS
jgi:hypothetical protein